MVEVVKMSSGSPKLPLSIAAAGGYHSIAGLRLDWALMLTQTRLAATALFAVIVAQPVQMNRPSRDANIRLDVNLVLVPVSVTDRRGATVTGLAKDQFRLFEDKVQQKIVSFAQEEAPVSVGVVFDLSGSMKNKIKEARNSSAALFKTATDGDEAFL